ncbi:DNA-3-methyladenine glycosylase [Brevundimonas alba]|uniref:Putative 3-methyladenine DNA glycosylase n=1 Tax=Brevundimonas alba TaxID=74314 RepID=A0A7X6BM26_9CAUL|nr:DNA-3-methyladenine glycosylase [Brevundimonas alba]NJC39907.1 DNA-3-methyladenine glycosylase [Brevundimonas alba]
MPHALFNEPAETVARTLIGAELEVDGVGGVIVETEAYDISDPASHSFGGPTRRNAAMFGATGCAYVYRIYGLHWCFNVVCDAGQPGSAVLVRALEPRTGLERMHERRGLLPTASLCSGPGKLCEALGIDGSLNGRPLDQAPFALRLHAQPPELVQGVRIGITKGAETPWRFGLKGSRFLSRPFPAMAATA